MKVMESGEDYLETILILSNKGGSVRSVDIAAEMKVTKASVSVAMKNLKNGGYIEMNENHEIFLTKDGLHLAEKMYERHLLFSEVLSSLGVDLETAIEDACRMEHVISSESFEVLKEYFLKYGVEPPTEKK